jgi:hypothetical protein
MNQHYKAYFMRNKMTLHDTGVFDFFNDAPKVIPFLNSDTTELEGFNLKSLFTFELKVSTSSCEIGRENYTFLQFIGDVGALHSTLFTLIELFLSYVLSYGVLLDNHLINGLFRLQKNNSIKTTHLKLTYF